jgi:beta-lactamase class A
MMLVSDNDAYSRVYELLGADSIKLRLKALGMKETDIIQRFDPGCKNEDN